jgi:glycosyltransferase involved in cell wall biosynthesis
LRRPKRPDLLIDIARRLPSVRFVACGGPTTFATQEAYTRDVVAKLQAQPNIDFLGKVSREKSLQAIADAALLLSTADVEGFPNTFLEAWCCGTPIVSLSADPDGVIKRQGLGSVVGDPERAAAEITRLLSSPQSRDEIAHRTQDHVATAHSESAAVNAFERVIRAPMVPCL